MKGGISKAGVLLKGAQSRNFQGGEHVKSTVGGGRSTMKTGLYNGATPCHEQGAEVAAQSPIERRLAENLDEREGGPNSVMLKSKEHLQSGTNEFVEEDALQNTQQQHCCFL